jgi:phosphate:Na+ symporter
VGFENPVLALLAGFVVTAIIQSSTATTAMLIAFLAVGYSYCGGDGSCTYCLGVPPIPFQTSAFILLGVNIGTSLTTVIASIPANRDSKRAALFHIMYDIIGSIVFGTLIFVFPAILDWFTSTWAVPSQQAAMFHTLYNVSTMVLLLPFIKYIAALMQKIVPVVVDNSAVVHEKKLMYLSSNQASSPAAATTALNVMNAHLEICRMWKIANENLDRAIDAFFSKDIDKAKKVIKNEATIDYLHQNITAALANITNMRMSAADAKRTGDMFVIISEIEQIGDRAENIAEYVLSINDSGLEFSEEALAELKELSRLTSELLTEAENVYEKQDRSRLEKIGEMENKIDEASQAYLKNHFSRLKAKSCESKSGVIFTDIVVDLEKSADSAEKIVEYLE